MQQFLFKWREAIISKGGPRKSTTRHILLTLSLHMDQAGNKCFPSTRMLAVETGLSRRVVCLHLDLAERDGWIRKEICGFTGRGWKRHRYIPLIPQKVVIESNHVNKKGGYPNAEGGYFHAHKVVTQGNTNSSYNSSNNSSCKYSPNSIEFELSSLLLNLILERNQKFKKPDLQKWASHIDKAMRLDGRTEPELRAVIEWCQADDFWQNNILSTQKLRQQFDKLWMQMEAGNGKTRQRSKQGNSKHGNQGPGTEKYSGLGRVISTE